MVESETSDVCGSSHIKGESGGEGKGGSPRE